MLANTQPPEKISKDPSQIEVVEIWDTIQGEGPYVGMPAVFVRLAGCNLQCPLCDTDYTTGRRSYSVGHLLNEIISSPICKVGKPGLVVFTGGEPFRQNIGELVKEIVRAGLLVQIETNGTIYPDYPFPFRDVVVVCSPKTPKISAGLYPLVNAWKYVLEHGYVASADGLPIRALGGHFPARPFRGHIENGVPIYVQPCDEQDPERNKLNTRAALDSCMRFGYRLCLQVHKIVGLK